MKRMMVTVCCCFSLLFALPLLARAQEERESEVKSQQETIRKLQQQLENIQRELAAQGAAGFGGPGGAIQDPSSRYRDQFAKQVKEQENRLAKLIDKYGEEHEAVEQARRALGLMKQQERFITGGERLAPDRFPGGGFPGGFGGRGAPGIPRSADFPAGAPRFARGSRGAFQGVPAGQFAQQYQQMLNQVLERGDDDDPGRRRDQGERGREMVMEGLELQLASMARDIRAQKDEEARAEMSEEFRDLAGMVVKARQRYRERAIKRLERELAKLREQEKESETVDSLLERLLGSEDDDKDPQEKDDE